MWNNGVCCVKIGISSLWPRQVAPNPLLLPPRTTNEPLSPATLVMDSNPRLTYLILSSPLPVVFLSASPRRVVIRHVENTHENPHPPPKSSQSHPWAPRGMAATPGVFCLCLLAAEGRDGCDDPAVGGQLAPGLIGRRRHLSGGGVCV